MSKEIIDKAANAGKTGSGVSVGGIIEGVGKVGVDLLDAAKRRQMDFALNQQQLQAQLGLAEKAAQNQLDIARMAAIAQAASGKGATNKSSNALFIGASIIIVAVFGTVIYIGLKR